MQLLYSGKSHSNPQNLLTTDDWVILYAVGKETLTEDQIYKKVRRHAFTEPTVFAVYIDSVIDKGYLNRHYKNGTAFYSRYGSITES